MKSAKITALTILAASLFALAFSSCGGGGGSGAAPANSCSNATQNASPTLVTTSSTNVLPLYIADSATTGNIGYTNEPLVSVTVCTPGHTSASQCQTISNILLDTGSYGLRVFKSVIASNVALAQQTVTVDGETLSLGECAEFGTGADWGSVQKADVVLGNQTASNIPIQVIDIGFGSIPSGCSALSPDTNPCSPDANFNGILGIGLFAQDCGADCNSTDPNTNTGQYFGCDSTGCYDGDASGNAIPIILSEQITNPVPELATGFNNGSSITLPSVGSNGASQVAGTFTLGIGSTAGNVPGNSVKVYGADGSGETDGQGADFQTTFNGTTYGATTATQAFLDSGSNAFYFPAAVSGLPACSDGSGYYCPVGNSGLSATILGFTGTPSVGVSFSVGNAMTLLNSSASSFSNVAADAGTSPAMFDWGLPFFFGRTVYVGINSETATFHTGSATGPYWAF